MSYSSNAASSFPPKSGDIFGDGHKVVNDNSDIETSSNDLVPEYVEKSRPIVEVSTERSRSVNFPTSPVKLREAYEAAAELSEKASLLLHAVNALQFTIYALIQDAAEDSPEVAPGEVTGRWQEPSGYVDGWSVGD